MPVLVVALVVALLDAAAGIDRQRGDAPGSHVGLVGPARRNRKHGVVGPERFPRPPGIRVLVDETGQTRHLAPADGSAVEGQRGPREGTRCQLLFRQRPRSLMVGEAGRRALPRTAQELPVALARFLPILQLLFQEVRQGLRHSRPAHRVERRLLHVRFAHGRDCHGCEKAAEDNKENLPPRTTQFHWAPSRPFGRQGRAL